MKIPTSTFKASRLEVLYCDLVKYCLVRADEAPLDHLLLPVRVEDGVAHVEQLALVGHVRVVAVPGHVSGQGHVSRSRRTHPRPSQLNSSTMFSRMESASATSPSSDCLCSSVEGLLGYTNSLITTNFPSLYLNFASSHSPALYLYLSSITFSH